MRQHEVDEGAEGHAGGAFGEPGLGVVVPGGAGDVQVDPGSVAGEFLDEHGAGDGAAAFPTADVLDVGDSSLDEFAVLVVDGHLPHFFASGFRTGEKFVGEGLVGPEDADVDVGERDDDGAGEGRGVNETRGAKLLGVVDAIGEDEAAFCVSVEDFDGLAGHGVWMSPGFCAAPPGMFSVDGTTQITLTLGFSAARARMTPKHGGAPAMSYFIFSMPSAGLMEMPPVSKVTALPTRPITGAPGFKSREYK